MVRSHTVHGTSLSPALTSASSQEIGFLPEAGVRFHASSWRDGSVGEGRGLLDLVLTTPSDLTKVISLKTKAGEGGKWGE